MSPYRMSKLEAAMRVVIEFSEAFNRHDVAGMMQLMSEDCLVEHFAQAPDGPIYVGKQAATQFRKRFLGDMPDAHIEVEEIFNLHERCIMRWRLRWTAAPGQERHVRGVDIFRVREGLIIEQLSYAKG